MPFVALRVPCIARVPCRCLAKQVCPVCVDGGDRAGYVVPAGASRPGWGARGPLPTPPSPPTPTLHPALMCLCTGLSACLVSTLRACPVFIGIASHPPPPHHHPNTHTAMFSVNSTVLDGARTFAGSRGGGRGSGRRASRSGSGGGAEASFASLQEGEEGDGDGDTATTGRSALGSFDEGPSIERSIERRFSDSLGNSTATDDVGSQLSKSGEAPPDVDEDEEGGSAGGGGGGAATALGAQDLHSPRRSVASGRSGASGRGAAAYTTPSSHYFAANDTSMTVMRRRQTPKH
jgi:hypothetical protein